MTAHSYKSLNGYKAIDLDDDEVLEQWRTRESPANPGEAQQLVREIDRLREDWDDLHAKLVSTAQQMADCVERCNRLERERVDTKGLEQENIDMRNDIVLLTAERDGLGSMLIEVQGECVGLRRAFEAEAARQHDIDAQLFETMARQRGWLAPTETEETLKKEIAGLHETISSMARRLADGGA